MKDHRLEACATVQEPFLAYSCPKLRSEHLRSPCELNLAKAKELRRKFPHALLGPLEHCAACKGKDLVVREAPVSHLEGKTELAGRGPVAPIAPPVRNKLEESGMRLPLIIKKENQEYGGDIRPEVTKPLSILPPRCPKHPAEPQLACSASGKRAGQFLGACKVCMGERKSGRKPKVDKVKMTPAVARDLRKVKEVMSAAIKFRLPEVNDYPPMPPVNPPAMPACKRHPDRPAKIDSLGRNMRLCQECVSERGRKAGIANSHQGLTSPPVSIPLNQEKYAEIKKWLEGQALENERTLTQEIMYRLKLAMREASPLG